MLSQQDYHKRLSESALAWWRDAGVDYVCDDETVNWLQPVARPPVLDAVSTVQPVRAEPVPVVPAAAGTIAKVEWPTDIAALNDAIGQGAPLPGCGYGTKAILPSGSGGAEIMVIGDCPEEDEINAGALGAGMAATLLRNMLLSAGMVPDLTFQTALALSRPATASLPKPDLAALANFVSHQISLVQPKMLLITGTAACEALLSQDLMRARGNLHYINYDDRKTAAVATFHPRTLLAQPQLKGQAWKDLQMLIRKDCL